MSTAQELKRMRFLYSLNIAVTGALAAYCLLTPGPAAATLFGDSRWSGVGHGRGSGTAYQMLGSWWAAVCLVSLLGLRSPHKYSPVFLIQTIYKFAFLGGALLPLAAQGRWSAFPAAPAAVYSAYLLPLFACAPWGYLLGGAGAAVDGDKAAVEAKAE